MLLTLELCPSSYSLAGMEPEKERISGACVRVHEDAAQRNCPGHSLVLCRAGGTGNLLNSARREALPHPRAWGPAV